MKLMDNDTPDVIPACEQIIAPDIVQAQIEAVGKDHKKIIKTLKDTLKKVEAIKKDREKVLTTLKDTLSKVEAVKKDRKKVLDIFKGTLKSGRAEINTRFEQDRSGTAAIKAYCYLMDQVILLVHAHVATLFPASKSEALCLVAVGGYGRGELAPFSDIDLLFLLPRDKTEQTERFAEDILYFLWDMNIKVGHSVHTVQECIEAAQTDPTLSTALLERRHLVGNKRVYEALTIHHSRKIKSTMASEFLKEKLAERKARHKKQGTSRYVLEPNIKEGKGGLRDLQTIVWLGRFLYDIDGLNGLSEKGIFTQAEISKFEKAHSFLWSLRCALHSLVGRGEERLSFDVQQELAVQMNYRGQTRPRRIERLMKHYFMVARDVGILTRTFFAALHSDRKGHSYSAFSQTNKMVEGFIVEGNQINFDATRALDPLDLLRIFHVSQKEKLPIHPDALRIITLSLKLINKAFRSRADANETFLAILTHPHHPAQTLHTMNEVGILGRFLPEFNKIAGLMQFNMYHSYTVDAHTILTLDILAQIERGELKKDVPVATRIIHQIQSRRALYVAMLLHDIAKSRDGDHSIEGAKVALQLCPALGLSAEETETVSWLIQEHLTMSKTAFSRDVNDPQTAQDFAKIVQSPERLRLLLVLTIADIRGVGPNVWNGWKASLLRDLYWRTESLLSGEQTADENKQRLQSALGRLRAEFEKREWASDDIDAHIERGTSSYWLTTEFSAQARHAEMIRAFKSANIKAPFTLQTYVNRYRQVTEITLYAIDYNGLFSQMARTLTLHGCSIEGAAIHTLNDGMSLNSFYVVDSLTQKLIEDPDQLKTLEDNIEKSLRGQMKRKRSLADIKHPLPDRIHEAMEVVSRVLIDNNASQNHTVIEVNGKDRMGLLFELTRALTKMGLLIHSARIGTYGLRIVDVFYVKTDQGKKITDPNKKTAVQEKLISVLDQQNP